jgi:hypothetical protein
MIIQSFLPSFMLLKRQDKTMASRHTYFVQPERLISIDRMWFVDCAPVSFRSREVINGPLLNPLDLAMATDSDSCAIPEEYLLKAKQLLDDENVDEGSRTGAESNTWLKAAMAIRTAAIGAAGRSINLRKLQRKSFHE